MPLVLAESSSASSALESFLASGSGLARGGLSVSWGLGVQGVRALQASGSGAKAVLLKYLLKHDLQVGTARAVADRAGKQSDVTYRKRQPLL